MKRDRANAIVAALERSGWNVEREERSSDTCKAALDLILDATKGGVEYRLKIYVKMTCDEDTANALPNAMMQEGLPAAATPEPVEANRKRADAVNALTGEMTIMPIIATTTPVPDSVRDELFKAVTDSLPAAPAGATGGNRKGKTKRRGRKRSTRKKLRR